MSKSVRKFEYYLHVSQCVFAWRKSRNSSLTLSAFENQLRARHHDGINRIDITLFLILT